MPLPYKETLIGRLPIWDETIRDCDDVTRVVYTISSIRPIVERAAEKEEQCQ